MLVVTGTQGSGKTTTSKFLQQELNIPYHRAHQYTRNVRNVNEYSEVLRLLSALPAIIDCGIFEAFSIQLMKIPVYVILVQADAEEKYVRLAKRNNTSLQQTIEKYSYQYAFQKTGESLIIPNMILHTDNLKQIDTEEIQNELTKLASTS